MHSNRFSARRSQEVHQRIDSGRHRDEDWVARGVGLRVSAWVTRQARMGGDLLVEFENGKKVDLAKGDDAMLSVDFPNGTCVECEVDVLSVAPRLTVRCRARRTRDRDEIARAAKQTVGLRAWRLDRLAYRNVYARRVRAKSMG